MPHCSVQLPSDEPVQIGRQLQIRQEVYELGGHRNPPYERFFELVGWKLLHEPVGQRDAQDADQVRDEANRNGEPDGLTLSMNR